MYFKDKPFEIVAFESNYPNVYGNGLYQGIENTFSMFFIQIPSFLDGNLNIDIFDSKEHIVKTYITKLNDYLYEIKYLPQQVGTYKIDIRFNDELIPSSPFSAHVINPDKVTILDEGGEFFSTL